MRLKCMASIVFIAMTISMNVQAQPVKKHGNLFVKGVQLTDEHGNATVLNGISYGWHNWWSQFYNKESVK